MGKLNAEVTYASCAVLCAVIGAGYDLAVRRIPNALTLPAILFGLFLHFSFGGWQQLGTASVAGLFCGLIFLPFHLAGGMGAGDVKLIAAAGSIAGLSLMGNLLILTALAGGVMAVALALYRGRLTQTLLNICALVVHHRAKGLTPHPGLNVGNDQTLRLPYGVAIAAGSTLSLCLLIVQR
jgi:prepilin peptidase CpaA